MRLLHVLTAVLCIGCSKPKEAQGEWLKGTEEEKLHAIERQFRGFDNAMVETGYRYQELYWAGKDENWGYAGYQAEKITLAITNGLQRRPKRAGSARHFLDFVLPGLQKTIRLKDTMAFNKSFQSLTVSCNNCHAMEKVSYLTVKTPLGRQSPIR